jgi:hypothetical protein
MTAGREGKGTGGDHPPKKSSQKKLDRSKTDVHNKESLIENIYV